MKNRKLFMLLLGIYIYYICIEIFNSGVAGVANVPYFEKIIRCTNLIPFTNLSTPRSLFVSFVIYMPIAVLIRECYPVLKIKKYFMIFIILAITSFELIQVVTLRGYFDINQIILGSLGAFIAYSIVDFFDKFIPRKSNNDQY